MFGSFRFALALMVAVCHLWPATVSWWGMYAVFGFYTLSGYLMTLVLNERYWRLGRGGTIRFLANRALRIYPPYLLVLVLTLAAVRGMTAEGVRGHANLAVPESPWAWLVNVTIVGLAAPVPRLIPPAWSLDIELVLYLAMALALARRRWIATVWCLASLAYTGYLVATGANLLVRYVPPVAASLPFSIGSMIYYWRDDLPVFGRPARLAALAAFALHASLASAVWQDVTLGGFYVSLGLVAVVVAALRSLDERTHPAGAWDHVLGDLSYPLFLCHVLAGLLVARAAPALHAAWPGASAGCAVGLALVLAWVVHRAAEAPIAPLRARFRAARRAGPMSSPTAGD